MRVVFSCVAECQEVHFGGVYNLALSLRRLGGSLADAPFVANFIERVEPEFERRLAGLQVETRVVQRVYPRDPYANKMRMLELAGELDFDVLVALDCDIVVVGDIHPFITTEALRAKTGDIDLLKPSQWRAIFGILGLPEPRRDHWTTTSGQRIHPYFNTGVLLAPAAWCSRLYARWFHYLEALEEVFDRRPDIARNRMHHNQIAFACLLAEAEFPWRELPVGMNFSTNLRVTRRALPGALPPLLVHHHWLTDERGFVKPSSYPSANERIEDFNRARSEALRLPYRGMQKLGALERAKQQLRGQIWYHRPATMAVRRRVKRLVKAA